MKLKEYKNIYFVGIGGIGMSAIARYFNNKNVNISSIFSQKLYDKPLVDGKLNTKVLKDYSSDLDIMPYSINFIEL